MGKKKDEEQQKAYDLFCNTKLTQKEIAVVVGVSAQQLSKWVNVGQWEVYRDAHQVTVEKIIHGYYQQLSNINKDIKENHQGFPTPSHTDMQVKITNAIETLRKKYNLSAYHSVLREAMEWMMKVDSDKAKVFGPLTLEFLKEKAKLLNNDKNIG